jgi:hypothetical protein
MLICSPSNGGCDELTRRIKILKDSKYSNLNTLNKKDFTIVRVGRSESIHKDSDDFNLEQLCKKKFEELLRKKQCEKSSSLHEHFKTLQNTENTLIKKIKLLKSSSANNVNLVSAFYFKKYVSFVKCFFFVYRLKIWKLSWANFKKRSKTLRFN